MISGRDIVFISSIEWDFLWQVHQEIAFQFAAAGNRVIYIENTGVRTPGLTDAARVASRLRRWIRSLFSRGLREVSPNIFVVSPLVAPPFGSQLSRLVNRKILLPAVGRTARKMRLLNPFIWTYLPTDTAVDLINLLRTSSTLVAYYCGADFTRLMTQPEAMRHSEDRLLRTADFVFVTCAALFDRCQKLSQNVQLVPAVVNLDQFQLNGPRSSPGELSWARPTIGYIGGLHRFVDYALLKKLAVARPHWSFVFVGARTADLNGLDELGNVHLVGQRPHAELSGYIREFDVCLVPYLNTEGTATVVPMKINEYLAMGKPVVSTDLPTVCDFNDRHQVLLTAPNNAEQFVNAIEKALSLPCDAATVRSRREVAKLGDSKSLVFAIGQLIENRMKERSSKTLSEPKTAAVA